MLFKCGKTMEWRKKNWERKFVFFPRTIRVDDQGNFVCAGFCFLERRVVNYCDYTDRVEYKWRLPKESND